MAPPSSLRVSNVTVDKAVLTSENKILSEIPTPTPPIATAIDTDSFINFDILTSSKEKIIEPAQAVSMGKSGVIIVDYTIPPGSIMEEGDPFIMLFGTLNNPENVNALIYVFNLSSTTPSRLIRVIRTGITPLFFDKNTILGTEAVVIDQEIKYIYFQVNGIGEYTRTPIFTTIADWSFVVTLKNDVIEGQTYQRICFNVLL